jgi:hypothetical protein
MREIERVESRVLSILRNLYFMYEIVGSLFASSTCLYKRFRVCVCLLMNSDGAERETQRIEGGMV